MSGRKSTAADYQPASNLVYGLEHGSNPRQNAMNYQFESDSKQNKLNNTHGGAKRKDKRQTRRHKRQRLNHVFKGGAQTLVVPSFQQAGPAISPINNTTNSVATNQAKLDAQVNACNDCYATGTCASTPGCPQQGGKKMRPYSISSRRVMKSPFRNIKTLKKTLTKHRKGKKIGYTQRSSLRSMGLIPRANGKYQLGNKYKI